MPRVLSSYAMRFVLAAALMTAAAAAQAADPLPRLNILPGSLTVSGVSAGGYMATQYQVAYSKDVIGAGIVSAGPWYCASGKLTRAINDCTKSKPIGPETRPLVAALRESADAKAVDDPSWIAPDRIWMFHGKRDRKVGAAVSDSLLRFYKTFVPPERMRYETQVAASHGFPTAGVGGACDSDESPWILDCGFDAAGEMLRHLYDDLKAPAGPITGELRVFDQARYVPDDTDASLAETGLVFVPKECAAGRPCRIHVVFHGCRQGIGYIGKTFAREAGYNRWADANRIVVLYPQVARSFVSPFNPSGCWDWWGYTGDDYATRNGLQLAAVRRMLAAIGGN